MMPLLTLLPRIDNVCLYVNRRKHVAIVHAIDFAIR